MPKLFEKGTSGNPGGRPKSKDLRTLCRTHTAAAVEELARLALHATGQMVRVVAIRELLDRGYGRPLQGVDVTIDDTRPESTGVVAMMPDELAVALNQIIAKAESEMGIDPVDGLTEQQRIKRMVETGKPLPPDLYKAIQQAQGTTRH
jgi:hypothetical protein